MSTSVLGQQQKWLSLNGMSALPSTTDMQRLQLSAKKIDVVRRGAVSALNPRNQTSRCLIARVRNRPQTASRPQRPLPDGSLQIVVRGVKEDPGDPTV
jgi:hypothetical protein